MISRRIIGWLIVVFLCVLVAVLLTTPLGYPLYPNGKVRLVDRTSGNLAIKFWYPEFGRANVDSSISEFRDSLIADIVADDAGHAGEDEGGLRVGYRVVYRSWRLASVVFDVAVGSAAVQSAESETGSSEVSYSVARTYDLWNDRVVTLDEVAGHTDALSDLFSVVLQELKSVEGVDPALIARNVDASEARLGSWVVSGSDIIVYLNPGQVAPRSRGVIEVRVPLEAIQ